MQTKIINKTFPYSVYALTLTVSPLFYFITMLTEEGSQFTFTETLQLYTFFIIFGIIYSAPSLIIFLLTFNLLRVLKLNVFLSRIILTLIGVLCISVTLGLIKESLLDDFGWSYSIVLMSSTLLLRYEKKEKPKDEKSLTN